MNMLFGSNLAAFIFVVIFTIFIEVISRLDKGARITSMLACFTFIVYILVTDGYNANFMDSIYIPRLIILTAFWGYVLRKLKIFK